VRDDDDAVAGIDQTVQHADQAFDVGHVQADGGFVENVDGVRLLPAAHMNSTTRKLERLAAYGRIPYSRIPNME